MKPNYQTGPKPKSRLTSTDPITDYHSEFEGEVQTPKIPTIEHQEPSIDYTTKEGDMGKAGAKTNPDRGIPTYDETNNPDDNLRMKFVNTSQIGPDEGTFAKNGRTRN